MIRAIVEQTFDQQKKYFVLAGTSEDAKPTSGLITGSEFHEVDTGLTYQFDEVGASWHVVGLTPADIQAEIDAWLDEHPEATTTVEDGAISYAKLDSSLKGTVDKVDGLAIASGTGTGSIIEGLIEDDGSWAANVASDECTHAEGYNTTASAFAAHAEGRGTTASGQYSHAEGQGATASGKWAHAEGYNTEATANGAHAEGTGTQATKDNAHAEGSQTTASGSQAHAEGYGTTANHKSQHVFGEYNVADDSAETANKRGNYVEIVGNGTAGNARANARTLDWSGNEVIAGDLTVNKGTANEVSVGDLKSALSTKAEIDGSYADMTVGNAEQLVATVGVEDQVPYNFRTAGGSADIGDREVDKIVGGTIAWNQIAKNGNFEIVGYWTSSGASSSLSASDNVLKVTSIASNVGQGFRRDSNHNLDWQVNHVYFVLVSVKAETSGHLFGMSLNESSIGTDNLFSSVEMPTTWTRFAGIAKLTQTSGANIRLAISNATAMSEDDFFSVKELVISDLTQMFGSTIADYIYGLETATAGAGVAWFRKLFPKPYYAYDAGSLQSVQTSAHAMAAFNQWDEQWERALYNASGVKQANNNYICSKNYIRVVPNTSYCFTYTTPATQTSFFACWYDGDKNFIQRDSVGASLAGALMTSPSNAVYMHFCIGSGTYAITTYNNDICISFHWDGERDGEYEPYKTWQYALDDVELRGIPKLDANNSLYYDGDEYASDGTVTRRYGIVNLGDLTWTYHSDSGNMYVDNAVTGRKLRPLFAVCSKYDFYDATVVTGVSGLTQDKSFAFQFSNGGTASLSHGRIIVRDTAYTDAATFEAAMASAGVQIVYELMTATTEQADPYQNPQAVDDWGTEEYVDAGVTAATPTRDVAIPVGHDTMYRNNLRAKVEMAPESPDGDGDYIMRQTNGQNAYVPISFPADELPAAPTTDGNYHLKCTVSSGTATYTWEADE